MNSFLDMICSSMVAHFQMNSPAPQMDFVSAGNDPMTINFGR